MEPLEYELNDTPFAKTGAVELRVKRCLLSAVIKQTNKSLPSRRGIQSTAHFKKKRKKERNDSVPRSLHIRSPVLIPALNSQSNLKSAVPLKQYCLMQIAPAEPRLNSPLLLYSTLSANVPAWPRCTGSMVSMEQSGIDRRRRGGMKMSNMCMCNGEQMRAPLVAGDCQRRQVYKERRLI